ncbi:DUF5060 domain-containing protein [Aquimarina sp. ERC-38]|uniref:DUF5060 domain-containing protein n=1 Tax=Aquimarina sp. ERC-38 TaxID=2949996 RepID=UPI00224649A8|nr:DUF5060 domain-containing protein [Aquimarina sp. ERC-38]UZO81231.1 DUF5060 domain-containing protein [Aquimarina sp. ERC-38]
MKSIFTLLAVCAMSSMLLAQNPSGELKRWHKITLSFTGPNSSESSNPNPFTNYRLDVTFTNGSSSYTVPGYYAGCENPADTSCDSGAVWKVHFAPGKTGRWQWTASFKTGDDIAIKTGGASAGFMDGKTGSFQIAESDKSGRDLRAKEKGMLSYVGEHYLRYAGTNPDNPNGVWFVKAGADSPENTLNYVDFDATPSFNNNLNKIGNKTWQPHQRDYNTNDAGAYTWGNGKGTEILGMINYLAGQGANAISFLTWNTSGDGGAVFPHTLKVSLKEYGNTPRGQQWSKVNKDRFDVSKLAQWEKFMEYGDKKGMFLHFKTMETENDNLMDGNNFGRERKLYYRELIARFGHHLALNWNLTEETTLKDNVVKETAKYIKSIDPYNHHMVIHTYPGEQDQRYNPLIGNKSELTGASIQTNQNKVHDDVRRWLQKSRSEGKKWVVANDEQGSAAEGVRVSDKQIRDKVLWATLLAGGTGVEYYSGYTNDDGDINGNDHRKRGDKYKQGGYALTFFNTYLQEDIVDMLSADAATTDNNDYVFAKAGKIYAVYRPNGGTTKITLPSGNWKVQWYNPRTGGNLSSPQTITNTLSAPDNSDWVALIKGESNVDSDCKNLTSAPTQDAYLEGNTRVNTDALRTERGNRIAYLQFVVPSTTKKVESIKLQLTVNNDPGQGTIDIFKGTSNSWTEANLSNNNKPSEGVKIGSITGNFNKDQTYEWELSNISQGERVSLIVKHSGSNDVSFYAKEGTTSPQILVNTDCDDTDTNCGSITLNALTDFPTIDVSGFSPAYKDRARKALAINASLYKDKFAAAEATFRGETGVYNIALNTLAELDGESSYRVVINNKVVGTFQNPETDTDYRPIVATFKDISITKGAKVRVEFNSNTNGKIPEGNSTAFARGRWTSIVFNCKSNTLSLGEVDASNALFLVPNPAQDIIALKGLSEPAVVTIYNTLGKKVISEVAARGSGATFDIQSLSNGIYFMVIDGNKEKQTLKFLKQ